MDERRPILELRPIDGIHVGREQPETLGGTVRLGSPPKEAPVMRVSPDPYPAVHTYVPTHYLHRYEWQLPFTGKIYFPVGLPYTPADRVQAPLLREDWRRPETISPMVVTP